MTKNRELLALLNGLSITDDLQYREQQLAVLKDLVVINDFRTAVLKHKAFFDQIDPNVCEKATPDQSFLSDNGSPHPDSSLRALHQLATLKLMLLLLETKCDSTDYDQIIATNNVPLTLRSALPQIKHLDCNELFKRSDWLSAPVLDDAACTAIYNKAVALKSNPTLDQAKAHKLAIEKAVNSIPDITPTNPLAPEQVKLINEAIKAIIHERQQLQSLKNPANPLGPDAEQTLDSICSEVELLLQGATRKMPGVLRSLVNVAAQSLDEIDRLKQALRRSPTPQQKEAAIAAQKAAFDVSAAVNVAQKEVEQATVAFDRSKTKVTSTAAEAVEKNTTLLAAKLSAARALEKAVIEKNTSLSALFSDPSISEGLKAAANAAVVRSNVELASAALKVAEAELALAVDEKANLLDAATSKCTAAKTAEADAMVLLERYIEAETAKDEQVKAQADEQVTTQIQDAYQSYLGAHTLRLETLTAEQKATMTRLGLDSVITNVDNILNSAKSTAVDHESSDMLIESLDHAAKRPLLFGAKASASSICRYAELYVAHVQAQLAQPEQEFSGLHEQVVRLTAQYGDLESQNRSSSQALADVVATVERLEHSIKANYDEAIGGLTQVEAELSEVRARNETEIQALSQATLARQELEEACRTIASDLQIKQLELEALTRRHEEAERKVTELRPMLAAAQVVLERAHNLVRKAEDQLVAAEVAAEALAAQTAEEARVAAALAATQAAEAAVTSAQAAAGLAEKDAQAGSTVEDITKQIAAAKQSLDIITNAIQIVESTNAQPDQAQLADLRDKEKKAKKTIDEMQLLIHLKTVEDHVEKIKALNVEGVNAATRLEARIKSYVEIETLLKQCKAEEAKARRISNKGSDYDRIKAALTDATQQMKGVSALIPATHRMQLEGRIGSYHFSSELVRQGEAVKQVGPKGSPTGVVLKTASIGADIVYEGQVLKEGDYIRTTVPFQNGYGELHISSDGAVSDKTNVANITPQEATALALEQAKAILQDYDISSGMPIELSGGPASQANKVYAALLFLSDGHVKISTEHPGISIPKDVAAQKKFVEKHLEHSLMYSMTTNSSIFKSLRASCKQLRDIAKEPLKVGQTETLNLKGTSETFKRSS